MDTVLAPGVAAAAKNAKPGHGSVGASVRGLIRNRSSAWSVAVGRVKWGRKSGNTRTHLHQRGSGRTACSTRSHRSLLIKMKQSRRGEGALNLGRGLRVSFF